MNARNMLFVPALAACAISGLAALSLSAAAADKQEKAPGTYRSDIAPFLEQYCQRCHGPKKQEAKLALHSLAGVHRQKSEIETWTNIFNKLKTGEMPPKKARQPSQERREQVLEWISSALKNAGKPIDVSRWNSPSTGNWVDHDTLFSSNGTAQSATRGRLWRLTGQAYEEFMQQKNVTFRLGFRTYGPGRLRSPWELPSQEGFRDYASAHRIGEPEIEAHLRNSTRVARAMIYRISKRRGIPKLQELLKAGKSATNEQIHKATKSAFDGILGRPPSSKELDRYAGFLHGNLKGLGAKKALEQLLIATLFHPEVLYRVEIPGAGNGRGMMPPRNVARAIAYSLTDCEPDAALQKATKEGKLAKREDIGAQITRILNDRKIDKPRILRFFQEFFGYPAAIEVFKDEATRKAAGFRGRNDWHPNFFVSDTDRLILWILDEDKNVLRELLTTPKTFALTGETKQATGVARNKDRFSLFAQTALDIYELKIKRKDWTGDRPFAMPAKHRMGVLSHPSWLIAHSTNFDNHAIHRGRWIRERLLGGNIPDIPVTVDAQLPDEPDKTLRQRMRVTRKAYCWRCHQKMDPLGLPFENYDGFGRYRTMDLKKSVDATGHVYRSGDVEIDGPVQDPFELLRKLASSKHVEQVFVRHAFRYFLGRNETLEDGPALVAAHRAYTENGGSMKALITSLLTSDAFLLRTTNAKVESQTKRRIP